MATLANYQSYKIQAYAVITPEGYNPTTIDIQSFHLSFSLNAIPFGGMNVALGRSIPYGLAAIIHHFVDHLSIRVPVQIYLKVIPGANSYGFAFEHWPTEPFLVFDGRLTRTDYRRSRDSVSLNMRFAHWSIDLNSSSSVTRASHTLTPQQLSGAAAFRGGAGILPAFFAGGAGAELFTPANLGEDLWGKALGPWLQQVCNQAILDDAGQPIQPNTEGLAALARFEPFVTGGAYENGKELPVIAAGRNGAEFLATAIAESVSSETFESFAASTLWDKIIGTYAPDYHFAVVPLARTALVVPGMSGMRTPWQAVYGEEYTVIDSTGDLARPIRGVHLFSGIGSMTGALGIRRAEAADEAVLAGRYEVEVDGMIINANVPRWAANFVTPVAFGMAAAPFGIRGGAVFPGVGVAPAAGPLAARAAAVELWDEYARAVYIMEALRGRTGSIQGKLRFDIAPGSTIELYGVEDKFVEAQVGEKQHSVMYAEVESVGINVDAENLSASTTFGLKNMRTWFENTQDFMSITQHPLYDSVWSGSILVEEGVFKPQPFTPFNPG